MASNNSRKFIRISYTFFSIAYFEQMPIEAACGIGYCPIPKSQEFRQQKSFSAGLTSKFTTFEISGRSGSYTELVPKAEYLGLKGWAIGANVPLVFLNEADSSAFGLGNPLLYSEYRMAFGSHSLVFVDTQFEIPVGSHDAGLAGDHFMVLPYVSATQHIGTAAYLSGTLGVSTVIGGDESEGGAGHHAVQSAPVVNPHANQEFHYRTAIGADVDALRITPEAFVHGQFVLSEHAEQRSFINTGGTLIFHAGKKLGLQANLEYHISDPQRFGWRGSLGAKIGF